jgi:AAA15 family ATPase/GTPase
MLIEFRVENHRSLRDEQAISMAASRIGTSDDPRLRKVESYSQPLLPVAVIYGANASGKSNVLSALGFMQSAVTCSHRFWNPKGEIPRTPFAWGENRAEDTTLEVMFLTKGIRYSYGFSVDNAEVVEEWLFAWPSGYKQKWFTRDRDKFRFSEHLKGPNESVRELTRTNSLYLSAAAQNNHRMLSDAYAWFDNMDLVNVSTPIDDNRPPKYHGLAHQRQVQLKHVANDENSWLDLEQESAGTRKLLNLSSPIVQSLSTGSTLVVDELEASLHPHIGQAIVEIFNDPVSNPHDAQLIFTTHDTNLLGTTLEEPVLRRDQIWFTEKDNEGATTLYPLTDYKPRKAENLERGYLQGRYGAVPFIGDVTRITQ